MIQEIKTDTLTEIDNNVTLTDYPETVRANEEALQQVAGLPVSEDYEGVRKNLAYQMQTDDEQMLYDTLQYNVTTGNISPEAAATYAKTYVPPVTTADTNISLEKAAADNAVEEALEDNQYVAINQTIDGDVAAQITKNLVWDSWNTRMQSDIANGIGPVNVAGDATESLFMTQMLENTADKAVYEGKKGFAATTEEIGELVRRAMVEGSPQELAQTLSRAEAMIKRNDNKLEQFSKLGYISYGGDPYLDTAGYVEAGGIAAQVFSKVATGVVKAAGNFSKLGKMLKASDKSTQVAEGILKSAGKPIQEGLEVSAAGRVDKDIAEIAAEKVAIKAVDESSLRGIYNTEELESISNFEKAKWKNKLSDSAIDVIDVNTVEGELGDLSTVVTIGNQEGKAMTIKQAHKEARRLGLDGANSRLVRDGEGALIQTTYFSKDGLTKEGWDEWLCWFEKGTNHSRILSGPLSYIKRKFLGSAISASKEANARVVAAQGRYAGAMHEYVNKYETSLGKLNKEQQRTAHILLEKMQEKKGRTLDEVLKDGFQADEKVIQTMRDYENLYNYQYYVTNKELTTTLHREGVRQYNDIIGTKQSIKANENNPNIIVRNLDGDIVDDLVNVSDNDYFLVKLYKDFNNGIDANTTHLLMPKITTEETAISKNLLPYRAGGPRYYELGEHYLKIGSSMINPKSGNKIKGLVKTITTASDPKSANEAKKEIEAVLEIAKTHDIEDAVGIQKALDDLDSKYFKVDTYEDFKRLVKHPDNPRGILDPDYDVQIVRHGQKYQYADGTFEELADGDEAMMDLLLNQQRFYTERGNILDSVNGEHARIVNVKESFDRMIEKTARVEAFSELYQWYDKELSKFSDLIVNWSSIKNLPIQQKIILADVGTFARAGREGKDLLRVRALESLMDHGIRVLDARTTGDKAIDSFMTHTARALDAVTFHNMTDKQVSNIAKLNPKGAAKGLVYNMAMIGSVPQFVAQSMGTLQTLSMGRFTKLEPLRAAFGWLPARLSILAKEFGYDKLEKILDKGTQGAFMMSDEAFAKFKYLMNELGGSVAAGLQIGYSKGMTKAYVEGNKSFWRRLERIALMPVNEANGANYMMATALAVMQKPKASVKELASLAHSLFQNMTKAGASKFQAGKVFLPFTDTFAQWSSFPTRFAELIGDPNLTGMQKAKYYLSAIAMFGLGGSFLSRDGALNANQLLVDKTGMSPEMADAWVSGLLNNALKEYGMTADFGPHAGEVFEPFIKILTDPTNFDIMSEIPMLNAGNQVYATYNAVKEILFPDDGVYDIQRAAAYVAKTRFTQTGLKNLARWYLASFDGRYYDSKGREVARGLDQTQANLIGLAGCTPVEARDNRELQAAMRSVEAMYKLADEDLEPLNKNIQYYMNGRQNEQAFDEAIRARTHAIQYWSKEIENRWGRTASYNWMKKQANALKFKNITQDTRKAGQRQLGDNLYRYIRNYVEKQIKIWENENGSVR